MTNHQIIAQPWQIKAAAEGTLGTIILPLVPEIEPHIDGINMIWRNKKVTAWITKWPSEIAQCSEFPYQNGDRLYLAEEWWENHNSYYDYSLKSMVFDPDMVIWNPARTMPPEAAQYWFEITEVKATQAKYLDYFTIGKTGFYNSYPDATYPSEEFKNAWDKANPKHLWSGALWVIVIEVRNVNQ
jgi:hypothetical protein